MQTPTNRASTGNEIADSSTGVNVRRFGYWTDPTSIDSLFTRPWLSRETLWTKSRLAAGNTDHGTLNSEPGTTDGYRHPSPIVTDDHRLLTRRIRPLRQHQSHPPQTGQRELYVT